MRSLTAVLSLSLLLTSVPAFAVGSRSVVTVTATPRGGSIPTGAQRVSVMTLTLQNSCGRDATVRSITLKHSGLGSTSDIERVYAWKEGKRISTVGTSFQNKQFVTLQFSSLLIPSCATASIGILVDMSADASVSAEHAFSLENAQSIDTVDTADVRIGNAQTKASYTLRPGDSVGIVNVQELSLPRELTYGQKRVIARVQLQGKGSKDQQLLSVTFTNDGSAKNADLQNIYLQTSGGKIVSAPVKQLDGNQVHIVLQNSFLLEANQPYILQLIGDVRASSRRTVRLQIKEQSDLEAITVRTRVR